VFDGNVLSDLTRLYLEADRSWSATSSRPAGSAASLTHRSHAKVHFQSKHDSTIGYIPVNCDRHALRTILGTRIILIHYWVSISKFLLITPSTARYVWGETAYRSSK